MTAVNAATAWTASMTMIPAAVIVAYWTHGQLRLYQNSATMLVMAAVKAGTVLMIASSAQLVQIVGVDRRVVSAMCRLISM